MYVLALNLHLCRVPHVNCVPCFCHIRLNWHNHLSISSTAYYDVVRGVSCNMRNETSNGSYNLINTKLTRNYKT